MAYIKNYIHTGLFLMVTIWAMIAPQTLSAQKAADLFIQEHDSTATSLMLENGIPASLILGVSMIESAMGTSQNCKTLKNYFGVKGKNNLAKKGTRRSAYKQYSCAEKSFDDFVRIIKKKKWYPALKGNPDYKLWLIKLNKSGYAEAQHKWIKDIESVIKKYNLTQFDTVTISVATYGL